MSAAEAGRIGRRSSVVRLHTSAPEQWAQLLAAAAEKTEDTCYAYIAGTAR